MQDTRNKRREARSKRQEARSRMQDAGGKRREARSGSFDGVYAEPFDDAPFGFAPFDFAPFDFAQGKQGRPVEALRAGRWRSACLWYVPITGTYLWDKTSIIGWGLRPEPYGSGLRPPTR